MIASPQFSCIHLTEVFRQAATSAIISVAHRINQGRFPNLHHDSNSDFFFLEANEPEEALKLIIDLATRRLPQRHSNSLSHGKGVRRSPYPQPGTTKSP